ncbi:MAG: hypothetical protein AAGC86_15000 [Pseudomonadota bacterium]
MEDAAALDAEILQHGRDGRYHQRRIAEIVLEGLKHRVVPQILGEGDAVHESGRRAAGVSGLRMRQRNGPGEVFMSRRQRVELVGVKRLDFAARRTRSSFIELPV